MGERVTGMRLHILGRQEGRLPIEKREATTAFVRWFRAKIAPAVRKSDVVVVRTAKHSIKTPDGSGFGCFRRPQDGWRGPVWIFVALGDPRVDAITGVELLAHELAHAVEWVDGRAPSEKYATTQAKAWTKWFLRDCSKPHPPTTTERGE